MRALERFLLLQIIDQRWREHLYDMDYLREGIHLRGFAQIEPIVAYKNEAFTLFADLMNTIWSDFARMIFNVEVEAVEEDGGARAALRAQRARRRAPGGVSYSGGAAAAAERARDGRRRRRRGERARRGGARGSARRSSSACLSEEQTVGRNDPCWCGSGKKFKKCHGA